MPPVGIRVRARVRGVIRVMTRAHAAAEGALALVTWPAHPKGPALAATPYTTIGRRRICTQTQRDGLLQDDGVMGGRRARAR